MASLERDNLVVVYCLNAFAIWPNKENWPLVGGAYKRETTITG